MPINKVTMSMLAKHSGLSLSSVSRAIRDPHLTSKETQKRVSQSIAALNFDTQNIFKLQTIKQKSKKLLVIDNQLIAHSLINKGIESQAKTAGYKLLYLRFLFFTQQEIQQIINYTIHHHLDGIIIINDAPYLKRLLQYSHVLPPLILVNQFRLNFPCIYFDHLSMAFKATQYLINNGHKRIAILLGKQDKISTHHLESGYLQALSRANINISKSYTIRNCTHYRASQHGIKTLMQLPVPPTAVVCLDNLCLNYTDNEKQHTKDETLEHHGGDSIILGALDQCQTMNINIPSQLSVIYFSHSRQQKLYHDLNFISAIYKPLYQMGESAVNLLLSLIEPHNCLPYAQLIDCQLIIRHSVAKIEQ